MIIIPIITPIPKPRKAHATNPHTIEGKCPDCEDQPYEPRHIFNAQPIEQH